MKNYDQSQNLIDWLTVTRAVAPKNFYEHLPAFVTPYTQTQCQKISHVISISGSIRRPRLYFGHFHAICSNLVSNFLRHPVHSQTDKTNGDDADNQTKVTIIIICEFIRRTMSTRRLNLRRQQSLGGDDWAVK